MELNDETGLPAVPEDHYWEVVEVNWPLSHTLQVELRREVLVEKSKVVVDELPKRWWQMWPSTMTRTVKYNELESECLDSELLADTHIHYSDEESTKPVGQAWVPYPTTQLTTGNFGSPYMYNYTTSTVKKTPSAIKYYRPQANTAENVRAAADKICKRLKEQQDREAIWLREAEERANLIGKYPPKTLKG